MDRDRLSELFAEVGKAQEKHEGHENDYFRNVAVFRMQTLSEEHDSDDANILFIA
jgi:hypothetical protein